jgi:Autographiviridae putative DNA helicase
MSLELTALRLFKKREVYARLARSVPERALDQRTAVILSLFGRYFAEHEGVEVIQAEPFTLWFKLVRPKLTAEDLSVYAQLFKQFDAEVEPGVEKGIVERLVAADAAAKIADTLEQWQEGADFDLFSRMQKHQQDFESQLVRRTDFAQELTPIEEILAAEENEVGFKFRLRALNDGIKPLRGGDFMIVAARPDQGKTTLLASELTFMASQVDALYPTEKRSIIWLNNEGPSRNIVLRCFQAAGGWTDEEMFALDKKKDEKYGSKLRAGYAQALGGRPGVLRIFSIHDRWNYEVEDILKTHKPAVVVFDMIDNVKFGGDLANNGTRTDQVLEAMYQWARMLAVKYDCAMIATSQISADGENMQWPSQSMLKDSKTGKQGAADVILMMGSQPSQPTLQSSRYLSTPKNKRKRRGVASNQMNEVIFDPDHARVRDTE